MTKFYRMFLVLICAGMLSTYFGCSTTPAHESAGEVVDDSVITTKVKTALANEIALKSLQINVKTYQGVVQLSGFVDSAENAKKAGEVAQTIKGVKEVKNDLIVK